VFCVLFYVDIIAVITENRLRSIINDDFFSFYYVALLHSTLANNVSLPWSSGWGTMAATGQQQPPWLGYSFCALVSKTYK
jgi:hypothetical protein